MQRRYVRRWRRVPTRRRFQSSPYPWFIDSEDRDSAGNFCQYRIAQLTPSLRRTTRSSPAIASNGIGCCYRRAPQPVAPGPSRRTQPRLAHREPWRWCCWIWFCQALLTDRQLLGGDNMKITVGLYHNNKSNSLTRTLDTLQRPDSS